MRFSAFWTVLKVILQVLQCFPSLFQFLIEHSRQNLALMVTVNYNLLCRNRKRVSYRLIISQHSNGCYLFCLNRKLPDLTFICKFLILISMLFALNFNIQSSGFGMTSHFHSVLKHNYLRYRLNFFVVLWCSETPNFPLKTTF